MKTGVVLCVAVSTVLTTAAMSEPLGVSSKPPPGATVRRVLSFEERVAAQQAIDKVYYAHTVGRTKSFDEVEPRSVAESKVRKYLAQSAALAVYWNTPVTDEMLERELERMATRSRMPERLTELYAALRYDTVLVKECLARPVVVDRLTRNFYAFDRRFHAPVRRQADELRERLTSGRVDPAGEYSARREFVLCLSDSGGTLARPNRQAWFDLASPAPFRTELNREEYGRRRARLPRAVGEVSPVEETADAFTITVLLSESPKEVRAATYTVPKTPWDTWWASVEPGLDSEPVPAVASDGTPHPHPMF